MTDTKVRPIDLALDELAEEAAHIAREARTAGDIETAATARALATILRRMHTRTRRAS